MQEKKGMAKKVFGIFGAAGPLPCLTLGPVPPLDGPVHVY